MSFFSDFLKGTPSQAKQFPRFSPEQESILNMLMKQGFEGADFGGIEDLARKRFQEDTIPSLAERFTAMGGGQRSSAFESSLGRAGSDLESQLGALRGQFGMQKLGLGLQPRFETAVIPGSPGMMQSAGRAAGGLLGFLPKLLGLF